MLPKRLVCALTCSALIAAASADAADAPPSVALAPEAESMLRVGARVRLYARERKLAPLIGRVSSVDDQRVLLDVPDARQLLEVRRADIHGVEVSLGRRRATKQGALIGGIALAITGVLVGASAGAFADAESQCSFHCHSAVLPSARFVGAVGAAAGAGVGALVGSSITIEDWQTAEPLRISAHVVPAKRGMGASVSLEF